MKLPAGLRGPLTAIAQVIPVKLPVQTPLDTSTAEFPGVTEVKPVINLVTSTDQSPETVVIAAVLMNVCILSGFRTGMNIKRR